MEERKDDEWHKFVHTDNVPQNLSFSAIAAISRQSKNELIGLPPLPTTKSPESFHESSKEYESTSSETIANERSSSFQKPEARKIAELYKMNERMRNEITNERMHNEMYSKKIKSEMEDLKREFREYMAKTEKEKKVRDEQIKNMFDGMSILQKTINNQQNEIKQDRLRYKKYLQKHVKLLGNLYRKIEELKSSS